MPADELTWRFFPTTTPGQRDSEATCGCRSRQRDGEVHGPASASEASLVGQCEDDARERCVVVDVVVLVVVVGERVVVVVDPGGWVIVVVGRRPDMRME